MKTGDLARLFGVSDNTIRTWISTFDEFFSNQARAVNTKQRAYTEDDVIILATIAKLSADNYPHAVIKDKLKAGERVENPSEANFGVDTRMIPAAAMEQVIDSVELRVEIEQIRSERDRLLIELASRDEKIEQLQQENKDLGERLQSEIKDLQRALGRAEGRLEEIEYNRKPRSDSPGE